MTLRRKTNLISTILNLENVRHRFKIAFEEWRDEDFLDDEDIDDKIIELIAIINDEEITTK